MPQRFPLAPMNALILVLTLIVLPLPLVFLIPAAFVPWPASLGGLLIGGSLVLLWAAIWIWFRPREFVVDATGLRIEFPGRTMSVASSEIAGARIAFNNDLRERYGFGARVGAGGLWGGFGWFWSSKRGMHDLYVSRTDRYVIVERKNGRDLLITPDRPEDFVRAVFQR